MQTDVYGRFRNSLTFSTLLLMVLAATLFGCSGYVDPDTREQETGDKPGLVDDDAPEEFTTTESGLKYRILRKSDGVKPRLVDKVAFKYRGWLDDGREFETTYKNSQILDRPVAKLLPGWQEGLQLIGAGGMIELDVPEELAFGAAGQPKLGVPPHARLHFQIELIDVARYQTEPGPSDPDAPEEYTTTESGLKYRIRRKSSGPTPTADGIVTAFLLASLDDGTELKNSYRTGFQTVFPMSSQPPGLVEGLQLVGEGGMIELIVPPELGFGNVEKNNIPPGSTLHFLIELVRAN